MSCCCILGLIWGGFFLDSKYSSQTTELYTIQRYQLCSFIKWSCKCNGFCETVNGVLKSTVKKMCQERRKDWDRYLQAVLFAYRKEVPQASTGWIITIYVTIWEKRERICASTGETVDRRQDIRSEEHIPICPRLQEPPCWNIQTRQAELYKAHGEQKHHYDKKSMNHQFEVRRKMLVLLPHKAQ